MASRNSESNAKIINTVIIGETGSGKSTFINYLTNYFLHGSFDDFKLAISSEHHGQTEDKYHSNEHKLYDKSQSKTIECTAYDFLHDGYTFCFIDTPGIGDTRGLKQDEQNIRDIFEMVRNLYELSAIILVINGTKPRLTINVEYVLGKFRHQLPNAVLQNIFVILTNCSKHQVNFKPESIGLSADMHVFVMQNSAFSTSPSCWTPTARRFLKTDWENSMSTIDSIVDLLLNTTPVTTVSFNDMNEQRNELISLLHTSRLTIMQLQNMDDALETCLTSKRSESKYQFFEVTHVNYHNTICSTCHEVCHKNCLLQETQVRGSDNLKCCKVILNGTCTVCPNRCSYKLHYHDRKLIYPCSRATSEYLNSKTSSDQVYNIGQQQLKITENLQDQLRIIESYCLRIVDMCSGFNIVDELYTLIKFLESDLANLKSEKVKMKARSFISQVSSMVSRINEHQTTSSSSAFPAKNGSTEETMKQRSKKPVTQSKVAALKKSPAAAAEKLPTKSEKERGTCDALSGGTSQKKADILPAGKLARQQSTEDPSSARSGNERSRMEQEVHQEFEDAMKRRLQEVTHERLIRQLSELELSEDELRLIQLFRQCSEQSQKLLLDWAHKLSNT